LRRSRHRWRDNINRDVKDTDCENVNWIQIFDCSILLCFMHVILQYHQHSCLVVCLGSCVDGTVRITWIQMSECPLADFCERGNESLGSVNTGNFLSEC
jgi:hypothetical protein